MVSVDSSVVVQIINFLILILILNMVLYKPIRKILNERKRKITRIETEVNTCSEAITFKSDAYATGIRDARAKGQKEKDVLVDLAITEEKKIIEDINKEMLLELDKVRQKIEIEIQSVRQALFNDVDKFAKAISHKILGRGV